MSAPASDPPLPSPEPAGTTPLKAASPAAASRSPGIGRKRTKRPRIGVDLPVVYVEWDDHHSSDEWINDEDLPVRITPIQNQSIGWILRETDDTLMIFSLHSGNEKHQANNPYAHAQVILKKCITKRVVLTT